jgi:hypothetical protein
LTVFNADVDGKPGVAILLTYGPDRDWLKNLNASGGGKMRRHGKTFSVSNPQTVTKEQAATHVSGAAHRVFGRLPFEQAVLLTKPINQPGPQRVWSRNTARPRRPRTAG